MTIETPELDKISLPNWMEIALYSPLQQKEINSLLDKHVWITAVKQKIEVSKMETSHIQNCIKCFNGQGKSYINENYLGGRKKWLEIFEKELTKRR